jgi:hypothetical protein
VSFDISGNFESALDLVCRGWSDLLQWWHLSSSWLVLSYYLLLHWQIQTYCWENNVTQQKIKLINEHNISPNADKKLLYWSLTLLGLLLLLLLRDLSSFKQMFHRSDSSVAVDIAIPLE